jgi:hypothetical protein
VTRPAGWSNATLAQVQANRERTKLSDPEFGEGNTYDRPNLPRRVLGDAPAQAYAARRAAMTDSRRTLAIQDRAELTESTIISGHAEQDEAYLKNDLMPLLKKDNGNEYHTLLLLSSFADIDQGPAQAPLLTRAEATAMAAKVTPDVARTERTIVRYVPDLSYGPRPTS